VKLLSKKKEREYRDKQKTRFTEGDGPTITNPRGPQTETRGMVRKATGRKEITEFCTEGFTVPEKCGKSIVTTIMQEVEKKV